MTLEEARECLSLPSEGVLEKAQVRRAYLQAIKRFKPEVDPEGFQRVRHAYELLEGAMPLEAPVPAGPPVAVPVEAAPSSDEQPPGDHLRPYLERLARFADRPWPMQAQVGWDAYRAFPGDRAARELLLGLLPLSEARNDILAVLREGSQAGDRACTLRLLALEPAGVPAATLDALEKDSGSFEAIIVAQARVRLGQGDGALAALQRALADAALPSMALVDGALRVGLHFEALEDGARAKQTWARLRQYLGGAALPAGAPPDLAALYAVASGLEAADYLPPELRAELARGALVWEWPKLGPALQAAARVHGHDTLQRKLNRLRVEAPILGSVVAQYRPRAPGSRQGRFLPIGLVVAALLAARIGFQSCGDSDTASPPVVNTLVLPSSLPSRAQRSPEQMAKVLELQSEGLKICRDSAQRDLCAILPEFLGKLSSPAPFQEMVSQLDAIAAMAVTPAENLYLTRVRAALPGLCQP